ncbi:MAG: helix-turn-helix domain-containing protein [Lachnospiraceae bacterium]|nr:helix-turn-helix domain-containing protein [Lachnospiraceae bacterium]
MNQRKIGQFIAQRRKERNMTQKQLAEEIGVSDKTISKWETGASPT